MTNDAQLVVQQGPQSGETFPLDEPTLSLGRDPRNAIVIDHPEVSRRHARIVRRRGAWVVEDLDSTNGTFVNGITLVGPHVLAPGDVIGLSQAVLLTFQPETPTPEDAEPSEPALTAEPSRPKPRHQASGPRTEVAVSDRPQPPQLSTGSSGQPQKGPAWQDRPWLWIGVGFVVLLIIAACAALLLLGYLGVIPGLLSQAPVTVGPA